MEQKTILSNVSWRFIKGFLQFFSMILIVRNMNIADYGWYVSAISAFEVVVIFCLPGTIRIALRSALSNDGRFSNLLGLRLILLPFLVLGFILVPSFLALLFLISTIADQISMFARIKLNEKKLYLIFNIFENLKPLLLVIFVGIYIIIFDKPISLKYIAFVYCFVSVFIMLLNIIYAKNFASLSMKASWPEKQEFLESFYASGNGLIGIFIRRGAVLVAALSFSSTDAAYVNIALQFLTIFTMIYSGISLSMTRDIYDRSLSFKQLKFMYKYPLILLCIGVILSSFILYFFSDLILITIFGNGAIGASEIIYLTPIILLFQLPQLVIMGILMRYKKERMILFLNMSSILIFLPILIFLSYELLSLIIILLCFVIFTSLVYSLTFFMSKDLKNA